MKRSLNLKSLTATAMIAAASQASAIQISLISSTWTSGAIGSPATTQVGYVDGFVGTANNVGSTGTTTAGGVTVTFTATFVGSSTRAVSPPSFLNATGGTNPNGFIFGSSGDGNPLTINDGLQTISGTISNYQRWDFSFSSPVILDVFNIEDVDSSGVGTFRDIVAAEYFTTPTPGVAGSGVDPTLTLGSSLFPGVVNVGSQTLSVAVSPINLTNPNNTPEVRVGVNFGSTPIQSFSVYTFSDIANPHRTSLSNSSFDFTVVPEVSSLSLISLSLLGFLRRRR
jgi:hypothetical protein